MYPFVPYQTVLPQSQTIQYVNGRQSAETYQMTPNSSVILMDSNQARFYLKQTDASGIATIRAYDFSEAEEERPAEYVTKSEFESFKAEMKGATHEPSNDARKREQQYDDASYGRNDERREPKNIY